MGYSIIVSSDDLIALCLHITTHININLSRLIKIVNFLIADCKKHIFAFLLHSP